MVHIAAFVDGKRAETSSAEQRCLLKNGVETGASPIATPDGRIYCVSGGKSYVLKAGPKLEVLAVNTLGDPGLASPAVAAGRLYIQGGRFLWCVGAK